MKKATTQTLDRIRHHKGVAGAQAFLRWWRDELIGGLPASWRNNLKTEPERVFVRFENGQFVLLRSDGTELGRLAREEDPAITSQNVQAFLARLDEDNPEIYFLMEADKVLERRLVLPAAAADNLSRVIGFEMDRHTPFKADQVFYDCRIEERLSGGTKIRVQLVLAKREDVEYTARFCRERGLYLHGIDVAEEAGGRRGVNLLPLSLRTPRDRRQYRLNLALAGVFLVLLYGVMWQSVTQREEAIDEYQAQLRTLSAEAAEVAALRAELEEAAAAASFLAQKKHTQPAVVNLLAEMTEILPDNVWLQRLHAESDKLQISGQAPSAAQVVSIIDTQSKYLHSPSIRGAVTPDPQSGKERFTIEALIGQGKG